MKYLSLFIFIGFLSSSYAQQNNQGLDVQFFQAYAMNSIPLWKDGINRMLNQNDGSLESELALAKIYYAAAGAYMANKANDDCEKMLDASEKLIKKLLEKNSDLGEAHAVQSGVMGLRIALSPMKGMTLGGKSKAHSAKGVKYQPDSPFTNLLRANYLYYTPAMFGGDLKKSIEHLEKAKKMYEAGPQKMTWEYLYTLALLGQAYHKNEQLQAAQETYATALTVAPSFGWVKYVLQPDLEKDMD